MNNKTVLERICESEQFSLRLFSVWFFMLAFVTVHFFVDILISQVAISFLVVITVFGIGLYFFLNSSMGWFMWRGPIIEFKVDTNEAIQRYNETVIWLKDTYSEDDYKILIVNVIKFRKTSTAILFRLML